jgi:outer membrane protein TolC
MRKLIFIILLVLSCNLSVFAEKINKQMVEAETLKNGPSVVKAKLTLADAGLTYKASFNRYLPKVAFSTVRCFGTKLVSESERLRWGKDSHSLSASVDIPLGFGDCDTIKDNWDTFKTAKLNYKQSVADAIYASNVLYLDLITAYEKVAAVKRTMKRLVENRDLIKLKYNSGSATINLLQDEEDRVLETEHSLKEAQESAKETSENLLFAMGRSNVKTVLEIEEQIAIPKKMIKEPNYDRLITKTTAFLINQNAFEKIKADKTRTTRNLLPIPTLTLGCGYTPDMSFMGDNWDAKNKSFSARASVSYSIAGLDKYYSSKGASNRLQAASLEFSRQVDASKKTAKKLYDDLVDARRNLKIATDKLSSLEFSCEVAKKKYINGFGEYKDWCAIEYAFTEAQSKVLFYKKGIALKVAEWRRVFGDDSIKDEEE